MACSCPDKFDALLKERNTRIETKIVIGKKLMGLLRRAPAEADGSAMFMTSVVAKRMEFTPLRLVQVLDHLASIDAISQRPCDLKDHFRVAVLPGASK